MIRVLKQITKRSMTFDASKQIINNLDISSKTETDLNNLNTQQLPQPETETTNDWYTDKSFQPKWFKSMQNINTPSTLPNQPTLSQQTHENETIQKIIDILTSENGQNIKIIDMKKKSSFIEYMVIVEGRNTKQVYALIDTVRRFLRKSYKVDPFMPHSLEIQGKGSDWMTLDTGKIIVHSFLQESRESYDLEGLWEGLDDPVIEQARLGFPDQDTLAKHIRKSVIDGNREKFTLSYKQFEASDMINEDEIKDAMKLKK